MSEQNIGTVVQITGPVLDIKFAADALPKLLNAITIDNNGHVITVEVAQHIGQDTVRCIAMESTDGLMRGMTQLGEDFSVNRAFVPEMLLAARCMAAATELLKPYMMGESSETIGRVCLGTVRGDMHDIGKNLVKIMMEGSGLEVVDLGVDVTAKQFVDTAIEQHCDIIACSSLLTTTMPEMRDVVELAKARGIRDRVKIFVGGAPITPGYSDEIGADVYCPDAATAARSAVALLRGA